MTAALEVYCCRDGLQDDMSGEGNHFPPYAQECQLAVHWRLQMDMEFLDNLIDCQLMAVQCVLLQIQIHIMHNELKNNILVDL